MTKGAFSVAHPSLLAGALFAISWFILIDAWILMGREVDPKNHVNFTMVIPSLLTTIGFVIINLTSPSDVTGGGGGNSLFGGRGGGDGDDIGVECSKPFAFLFIGWFICIGSTILSLSFVGVNFLGETTRTQAFPGYATVFHSCLVPCVAAMMWFAKSGRFEGEEDDDW